MYYDRWSISFPTIDLRHTGLTCQTCESGARMTADSTTEVDVGMGPDILAWFSLLLDLCKAQ